MAAFILLGLYVLGTTEACQFLKLPLLVSHFIEHNQQNNSSISFFEYLTLHYNGENQHNDEHQDNDNQLPFKSVDHCCLTGHTTLIVSSFRIHPPVYIISPLKETISNSDSYIFNYTADIFQPPRLSFL